MKQYLDALQHVQDNGLGKADRTGTGTRAVFGYQMRFNLADGFPLLTTKKLFTRGIIAELLWILSGDTNVNTLKEQGVHIWDAWAPKGRELSYAERVGMLKSAHPEAYQRALPSPPPTADNPHGHPADPCGRLQIACDEAGIPTHAEGDGDLGRIYGAQWRRWLRNQYDTESYPIDQIANLIKGLKVDPTGRRHIVTAWNPGELDQMALPPCHCFFQFYCEELTDAERIALWEAKLGRNYMSGVPGAKREGFEAVMLADGVPRYRLSCQLYQRSADIFLGVPFNIASYALLTHMVAQVVNMVPGDFVHTFGDLHIYSNHFEQVELQLTREPRPLPRLKLNPDVKDIFSFKVEDFTLVGYDPHPTIKAEVSV